MLGARTPFAFAILVGLAACGSDNGIGDATIPNVIDTFTVASLDGGALQAPSAYSIAANAVVRTYETIGFEFAYTTSQGNNYFLPLAVLGLSPGSALKPGLIKSDLDFDEITKASQNGYITEDTVQVDSGDVFMARSSDICTSLGVPQYAKLQVISIDPAARTLTFQALADNNCGFRGLNEGIPKE
jgi:hypothetical protein